MGQMVCLGATCKCPMGDISAPIPTMSQFTVSVEGKTVCTINDKAIMTFGMCKAIANPAVAQATAAAGGTLTPAPCTPVITAPWAPGATTVTIGGMPVLNNTSKLFCTYFPLPISIDNAGQTSVQIP